MSELKSGPKVKSRKIAEGYLEKLFQQLMSRIDEVFDTILDDNTFSQSVVVKTFTWLENLSDSLKAWAVDIDAENSTFIKLDDTTVGKSLKRVFQELLESMSDPADLLEAFDSTISLPNTLDYTKIAPTTIDHSSDVFRAARALFELQQLVEPILQMLVSRSGIGPDSHLINEIDTVYLNHRGSTIPVPNAMQSSYSVLGQSGPTLAARQAGWSYWDTSGDSHFRSFSDYLGQILFFQWSNRAGHYTKGRDPNSSIMSKEEILNILEQCKRQLSFDDIPVLSRDWKVERRECSVDSLKSESFLGSQSDTVEASFDDSATLVNSDIDAYDNPMSLNAAEIRQGLEKHGPNLKKQRGDVENLEAQILSEKATKIPTRLPTGYTLRNRKFFRRGQVLSTVFSTPGVQASQDNLPTVKKMYVTLRPCIVFHTEREHCLCVPIFSYGGQGLRWITFTPKQRQSHSVVHMAGTAPWSDPEEGLTSEPFTVVPAPGQKLPPSSRIRFDMWHTLEYSSLVKQIGLIEPAQIQRFLQCVKNAV